MALWTDIVTPLELTTAARMSAEEYERSKGSLSEFLPNTMVDDLVVRLSADSNGLSEAAEFRAYDAETPIGSTPGGKRVTVELPALGQKVRVSEYDQLRQRGNANPEIVKNSIGRAAVRTARSVADRMELMRGQVLATGKATINENQFIGESDFGRDEDMAVTAATPWGNAGSATPMTDLMALVEAYTDKNGEAPGTLVLSKRAHASLMRADEIRGMMTTPTAPGMVSAQFVSDTFAAYGLPQILVYDRRVRVGGQSVRVLDEDKALLLPSEGSALGATFWGTTLEATDPNYGVAEDDRPGIVVGALKDYDPMGVWVHASAIGMPVLADANLAMAATVL